jgi:hypothetical protein
LTLDQLSRPGLNISSTVKEAAKETTVAACLSQASETWQPKLAKRTDINTNSNGDPRTHLSTSMAGGAKPIKDTKDTNIPVNNLMTSPSADHKANLRTSALALATRVIIISPRTSPYDPKS